MDDSRIRSKTALFCFENGLRGTMAVHMRYNSWLISLPSSAKQQSEMTNSALSGKREPRELFFYFYFEFIVVLYTIFQNGPILEFFCSLAN